MKNWSHQFVLLKQKKMVTTVYNVVSDTFLRRQKGFIVEKGASLPVSREGQEGALHIWRENDTIQDGQGDVLTIDDLFSTTTSDSGSWKYSATLQGTRFEAHSRYSENDAVKNVSERIIEALDGSYDPLLLTFRGWTCVVWRDPNDRWRFTALVPGSDGRYPLDARISGFTVRTDAEREAHMFLAILAWDGEEETSPLLRVPADQKIFTHHIRERKQEQKTAENKGNDGTEPSCHSDP